MRSRHRRLYSHFLSDSHDYLLGLDLDDALEEHEHAPEGVLGFVPCLLHATPVEAACYDEESFESSTI